MKFFNGTPKSPRLSLWDKIKIWRILKDDNMLTKLKSRKLWVATGAAFVATLLASFGFDQALIDNIIYTAMAYLGAQGVADAVTNYSIMPPADLPAGPGAKLKSRKLWFAAGAAAVATLLSGLGFDQALINKIIGVAVTYLGSQGIADAALNYKPFAPPPAPTSKG